jgi:hypothetical protein
LIDSLPGNSGVPTQGSIANDANVIPTPNENTTVVPPFQLPTTPGTYFLGIVIDPFHTINQTYAPSPLLRAPVTVGPPSPFLPAGNLLFTTNGTVPVFPAAPSTVINPLTTPPAVIIPPLVFSNGTTFSLNVTHIVSSQAVPAKAVHAKAVHAKSAHVTPPATPHKVSHAKAKS